jgi:small subunit ribosomal protein S6
MNNYFLTLVIKNDEKARKEVLDSLTKKLGGKLDDWGSRDLAYPIKHQTKGFYAHFTFEADPSLAKDLDKSLRVEEDILRFLLIRNEYKLTSQKAQVTSNKVEKEEEAVKPEKKMVRKRKTDGK